MASRVLYRIAKSGVTQRLILESRRHEPFLNLCGSFHSASELALVSSAEWLFSPASCFQKHTPLVNATFQRYGFSSTASPEPNDKESNQSAGHENESAKANGDSTVSEKTQDTDAEPDLSIDDLVKLVQEKEELLKLKHKEIEKMQDKVLRSYAEMENVLDRTRREAENSKKFAIQNFAKNLLDVADNLGRASSVVKDSFSKIDVSKDSTGAVPLLKTLLEGVEMTEKQLTEANVRDDSNTITSFITFVLGGPGSGKGTQCAKIAETFGFIHLSAGDLLRNEMLSDSENGAMIRDTIKEGRIVPSEVTVSLIRKAIESNKNSKILIDGFPRSDENRIAFERIVGVEPDLVVFFDCPEEEMVKRVLSRNQGRIDDNIDTVKKRLEVFNKLNLPVVNYYSGKGKVWKISAVGTVEQVFENVRPIFAALR